MPTTIATHLNFDGEARDALDFYASVFGGETTIATYGDFGMQKDLPGADRVVFGQVIAENGVRVLAYDVPAASDISPPRPDPSAPSTRRDNGTTLTSQPFFLAITADTVDEITALWHKLTDGAGVVEELGPSQWAPAFGMLTDRFGVTWILQVSAAPSH